MRTRQHLACYQESFAFKSCTENLDSCNRRNSRDGAVPLSRRSAQAAHMFAGSADGRRQSFFDIESRCERTREVKPVELDHRSAALGRKILWVDCASLRAGIAHAASTASNYIRRLLEGHDGARSSAPKNCGNAPKCPQNTGERRCAVGVSAQLWSCYVAFSACRCNNSHPPCNTAHPPGRGGYRCCSLCCVSAVAFLFRPRNVCLTCLSP